MAIALKESRFARSARSARSARADGLFNDTPAIRGERDQAPFDAYRDVAYTDPNVITGQDFWTAIKKASQRVVRRLGEALQLK